MTDSNHSVTASLPDGKPDLDAHSQEEQQLLDSIARDKLPRHIAIIMDGNGRWAREKGLLDRIRGHEAGSQSVRVAVRACGALGIKALTLYASAGNFSSAGTG